MYRQTFLRPAIAMIELIFAIVVIGITLLSAPLVLNQTIQSSTVAMQQESIAAAAAQIGLILTHNWDENTSQAGNFGILNVTGGNIALDAPNRDTNATYTTRRYNVDLNFTDATPSGNLGMEPTNFNTSNDIDDFNNIPPKTLTVYAGENEALINNKGEYMDTRIIMTNTVSYAPDTPTAATVYGSQPLRYNNPFTITNNSTNIKIVNVTLTTNSMESEHNKSIVLGAFSCNIGVPNLNNWVNYRPLQP